MLKYAVLVEPRNPHLNRRLGGGSFHVDLDTALEISKFAGTWKFTFEDYYEHFTLYSLNII
jgi:hypothetical protein